ncbi:MAG: type II toxin-antitoxin system RelE/ParE family toxin [Deltaproteobacteria bacterium]|nr:type II toxin-antitoxin system RelE/ParE family toxin [Deltaproteobacteria bacterium]
MSARFRLTKSAANDLLQIADYISGEDPAAAERVIDDIVSAIENLIKFPAMGRIREDLADRRHRV